MKMSKIVILILFTIIGFTNSYSFDDIDALMKSEKDLYKEKLLEERKSEFVTVNAVIEEIYGKIFVKMDNEDTWLQVGKGDIIKEKMTLISLEKSEVVVRLINESTVNIKENTRVYFYNLRQSPEKESLTETGMSVFSGKIISNVKNILNTGSKYELDTGSATIGVRGTKFMVEVLRDRSSRLKVYEGVVNIISKKTNKGMNVRERERVKLLSNGNFEEKESHNDSFDNDIFKPKENPSEMDQTNESGDLQGVTKGTDISDSLGATGTGLDLTLDWLQERQNESDLTETNNNTAKQDAVIKDLISGAGETSENNVIIEKNPDKTNGKAKLFLTIE